MVNKVRIAIAMAYCIISAQSVTFAAFNLADLDQENVGQNHGKEKQGSLSLSLHEFMDNVKELDYYTAKNLVLVIPGTGREIAIDWGFGGSGSMFDPFPTIEPQERLIKTDAQHESLAGLGSVLLKNELYKRSKSIPLIKWLVEKKVTPIKLFTLKLVLLFKNAYTTDTSKVKTEVMRLLVRLMLSEELYSFDEEKAFSSYLPEGSVEMLHGVLPGSVEFVDELWHELITSTPRDVADDELLNVYAVVLHNQDAAKQCLKAFKHYEGVAFEQDVTSFLQGQGVEVVDYVDLSKLGNIRPMINGRVMFSPITHLAAVTSFENVHENKNFKKEVGIAADALRTGTLVLHENNGVYWLLSASNKLELAATAKQITITLVKALRAYVAAKKQLLSGTGKKARAYREKCEKYEAQCAQINEFLALSEGQASQLRLNAVLQAIQDDAKNAHQLALNQLDQEIAKVEKEIAQKNALIQKFQVQVKPVAMSVYGRICQDVKALNTELERLQSMRQSYVQEDPAQLLEQKKQDLQDLLALAVKNEQSMSNELAECISDLKKEIAAFDQAQKHQCTLEQKIALRERVASAYQQEAHVLTDGLELKKQEMAWLAGIKRRVEELKFASTRLLIESYSANLLERAQSIRIDNKKARKLSEYREALHEVDAKDIPAKEFEKLEQLEQRVGYMFDRSGSRFLTRALEHQSEWQTFLQDFDGSVQPFAKIKNDVCAKLATIIKRSAHVQENMPVYRQMVYQFLPEFGAWFDQIVY
ncbi:hypothetical protein K2X40_04170 [Candidatus Babeliales bacterium]|nr:hypothetical protein [Candidatus Babeliales bacterium]